MCQLTFASTYLHILFKHFYSSHIIHTRKGRCHDFYRTIRFTFMDEVHKVKPEHAQCENKPAKNSVLGQFFIWALQALVHLLLSWSRRPSFSRVVGELSWGKYCQRFVGIRGLSEPEAPPPLHPVHPRQCGKGVCMCVTCVHVNCGTRATWAAMLGS